MKKWFSTVMDSWTKKWHGKRPLLCCFDSMMIYLPIDAQKFYLTFRGRFDISFRVTVKDDLLVSFHQCDVVDLHPGLAASTCRGHQRRVPSRWGQISAAIITAVTFAVIFAVFFNFDLDDDTLLALNRALGTSHLYRRKSAKGKHSSLFNET